MNSSTINKTLQKFSSWIRPKPLIHVVCFLLALISVFSWRGIAMAQESSLLSSTEMQGALNTIWVMVATVLVIFMNAGFGMLEAGFCRRKNAVNILAKNLIVFALASIAFWSIGFSLMFGGSGNSFIGLGGWFFSGDATTYGITPFSEGGLAVSVFFLFQAAFAGTAATIVSGAVAERIRFIDFLIFSVLLTGIAYPITGHWIWGQEGWLGNMGFMDFSGSTAVHSVGGWSALIGAIFLGPRLGKYQAGQLRAIPGHNLSMATLGCLILWVGWFGFNAGSTLAANATVADIALTTNLSAAAGGVAATVTTWLLFGHPDLSMIINGILAGLVAITAGCAYVSFPAALLIGLIAGVLVVLSVDFFDNLRIDDPVGAISVHLVCGVWGTLAVGLFHQEQGMFSGGGLNLLGVQILGVLAVGAFTVGLTAMFWGTLQATLGMRVTPEAEKEGLDLSEHGMEAYGVFDE
ncbi:MAG: ammonium transporter [Cyanothece sp. SIO1E1]|nr:ammonium transporter [Cyanothece sp. SIO1E1]